MHRAWLFAASVTLLGCSDGNRPSDGGPFPEAGAGDAWRGEGPRPDLYTGPCDPTCISQDISLCVRLPGENRCVECLEDSDCKGNVGALASKCDKERNYCICDTDGDCTGNSRGAHCELGLQVCVCQGDKECHPPLPLCLGTAVKTCRPACRTDKDCGSFPWCDVATGRCLACKTEADCQKNLFNRHCQISSGRCVACTDDSQCAAALPYCNSQGDCVECKVAAHCTQSPNGGTCKSDGRCGCKDQTDVQSCLSPVTLGAACLPWPQLANPRCGCATSADCNGKAVGRICQSTYQWCGCGSDADCIVAPSTTCIFPSENAEYRQCQAPCGSAPDCQSRLHDGVNAGLKRCTAGHCAACSEDGDCTADPARPHCQQNLGRCVSCTQDSQCGGLVPFCNAASGRCVECKTTSTCANHPDGPICSGGFCSCGSDTDCTGTAVWGKSCITRVPAKKCGCGADADCVGKIPGPHCASSDQKCSCLTDGECTTSGTVCALPYANAAYKYCQKPCQSSADCASRAGLSKCSPSGKCVACLGDAECAAAGLFCNTSLGICVGCKSSADCATEQWAKLCDPASGCAECLSDADCTPSTLGKTCSMGACVCSTNAQCADNLNGKVCELSLRACTCRGDGDCPAPRQCTGSLYGFKICK